MSFYLKNKAFLFIHTIIIGFLISLTHSEYKSINDLPSFKEGFSIFSFGLPNHAKPLYFIDINNDKM